MQYVIERCSICGVDVRLLIDRFLVETDDSARRALLLTIGNYDPTNSSDALRADWLNKVTLTYLHDRDAGIHAASEWLLKRWAQVPNEAPRATLEDAIAGKHNWFVNSHNQTFSVVRGPIEVTLGSPDNEPNREYIEVLHPVMIHRTFAIAMKELSLENYQRFDPVGGDSQAKPRSPEYPAYNMNWFAAAKYCRWLSEQEGIPEDQMCYPPIDQIEEGMLPFPDYLSRTGYRLPTEAELEGSARVGTSTQFCFGDSEELLNHYAWYVQNSKLVSWPPGLLKPNDLGLFDCHGNVIEFGQEWISHSSVEGGTVRNDDIEDLTAVVNIGHYRVARGGSYAYFAEQCRCALRERIPALSVGTYGIRLARTLPSANSQE